MLSDHPSYPDLSGGLNTFVEMDGLGACLLSSRVVFSLILCRKLYDGWNRPYDKQGAVASWIPSLLT